MEKFLLFCIYKLDAIVRDDYVLGKKGRKKQNNNHSNNNTEKI
jgi:hypothetical protein